MQVRAATEGSQQPMKSPACQGPPKVIQAGLRAGGFHWDPDILQSLPGDGVAYLATVGKGFLSLHLSPSYSKGERANWDREEGRGGRDKAHPPCPVLLWRCRGPRVAHFAGSGAAPSWVHLWALPLRSCLTVDRSSNLSEPRFLVYKIGQIITLGPCKGYMRERM